MISARQASILAFIRAHLTSHGYPPTLEEIRAGLGISAKSVVAHHLERLERAGLIERTPGVSRGIRLVGE